MTEPGHGTEAASGRGRFRAAHTDREQVIEVLKVAFVQGQLDRDELETRAGLAFAARTYADLAVLTADLPPRPAPAQRDLRPAGPLRPPVPAGQASPIRPWPLARAAARAGCCLAIAAVSLWLAFLADPDPPRTTPYHAWALPLVILFQLSVLAAPVLLGHGAVMSVRRRRSREQLPAPSAG